MAVTVGSLTACLLDVVLGSPAQDLQGYRRPEECEQRQRERVRIDSLRDAPRPDRPGRTPDGSDRAVVRPPRCRRDPSTPENPSATGTRSTARVHPSGEELAPQFSKVAPNEVTGGEVPEQVDRQ